MNYKETYDLLGNVDIYVIDQILKGNYKPGQSIFDAGCGEGRNLKWFYKNNYFISGMDIDAKRIEKARKQYPQQAEHFIVGNLCVLPHKSYTFDLIICCAVLHFVDNKADFMTIMSELTRVLIPAGTLLVRVASDIGLDAKKPFVRDSKSNKLGRFFISRKVIDEVIDSLPLKLIEPVKTTNVQDIRAMTTLVFRKE